MSNDSVSAKFWLFRRYGLFGLNNKFYKIFWYLYKDNEIELMKKFIAKLVNNQMITKNLFGYTLNF